LFFGAPPATAFYRFKRPLKSGPQDERSSRA
jgi:hypothetical protein